MRYLNHFFVLLFSQKDIFGILTVSPVSSGLCIGSSNWIISSGFEKVAYVSGSSTLTTHPRLIDTSTLRNVDCLILTSLTQMPTFNPGNRLFQSFLSPSIFVFLSYFLTFEVITGFFFSRLLSFQVFFYKLIKLSIL